MLAVLVIALPYILGEKSYGTAAYVCTYCPASTMMWGLPRVLLGMHWPSLGALIVLGIILVAMLFTFRPICGVLCPIGAIYGLANRISFLSIKIDREKCNSCNKCAKSCPARISPLEDPRTDECIYCLECFQCEHLKVNLRTN